MNYEQKYKDALERASKLRVQNPFDTVSQMVENIFPELQESEDERIRKEIIDFLELPHPQFVGKRDREKWIAWLEKQGEFDDNIITRNDEILQAISVGLTDVVEDAGWSDFGGIPIEEIQDWLEKQGEKSTNIDIDKMVMEYSQTNDGDFGLPVNCMLRAYRKGINDALFITLFKKNFGS